MSLSKGQEVSGHAVMVEVQVHSWASACGIYGGQGGIGTGFFFSQFFSFTLSALFHLCSTFIHSSPTPY
jgi:hypothetical protein